MFKNIDKEIEKIGYKKVYESAYTVEYEKKETECIHIVDIVRKKNIDSIIQSYDKNLFDTKGIGNTCVGLTYKEMRLFTKKMKKLKW